MVWRGRRVSKGGGGRGMGKEEAYSERVGGVFWIAQSFTNRVAVRDVDGGGTMRLRLG